MNPLEGLHRRIESRREQQFDRNFEQLKNLVSWTKPGDYLDENRHKKAMELAEKIIRGPIVQFRDIGSRLVEVKAENPDTATRLGRTLNEAILKMGREVARARRSLR